MNGTERTVAFFSALSLVLGGGCAANIEGQSPPLVSPGHRTQTAPRRDLPPESCGGEEPDPDNAFCTTAVSGPVCWPEEETQEFEVFNLNPSGTRWEKVAPADDDDDCQPDCGEDEECVVFRSSDLCCGDPNKPEK